MDSEPVCVRIPVAVKAAFAVDTHQTSCPHSRQLRPCSSEAPPLTPHNLLADDPQTNNDKDKNNDKRTRQLKHTGGIKETKRASKHQSIKAGGGGGGRRWITFQWSMQGKTKH